MRLFQRLLLVVITGWGLVASADPKCQDLPAPLKGRYCVYGAPTRANPNILYYFHGKGDPANADPFSQATQWGETNYYTEQVRQVWKRNHIAAPTVVAVTFGPIWLLAHKNSSPFSGLLDVFTAQIMPMIEHSLGGLPRHGRRLIMGESMGGFNSVALALQTNLFAKAAFLCAPMASGISPFSSAADVDQFILKSSAYSYYGAAGRSEVDSHVGEMIKLAQTFFPTPADWTPADPLELAIKADVTKAPKEIFMAAGFYDPYALYEGNEIFASSLRRRGFKVNWRPQWGGHCAIDIRSLATFLVR